MEKSEAVVLQTFKLLLQDQVDPIKISQKLNKLGVLNNFQKRSIISKSQHGRKAVWEYLFNFLKESCCLQQLLKTLLECGYVDIFLKIISQLRFLQSESKCVCPVQRTDSAIESRRFSQELFIDLKIKTHNISFGGNPRLDLRRQSEFYKTEYLKEDDDIERMMKVDKYAASLCAEIDAHTMLYKQQLPTHGLFHKLKEILPHTSNTHVTQVAYDSRWAIAHAIAENDDEGDDFLRSALSASMYIGHCVELVNMLYIYVFNLLCMYEKNPSKRIADKIMYIAELGLNCLQEEHEHVTRKFWMRMFYLRMIYCLLGISNRGDLIPGYIVPPKNAKKARDLLVEVDKIWTGIESRRLMFYYVAQARVAELENTQEDMDLANEYVQMAIDIGINGKFGETQFITEYAKLLKEKQKEFEIRYTDSGDFLNSFIVNSTQTPVEHDETTGTACVNTDVKQLHDNKLSDETTEKHSSQNPSTWDNDHPEVVKNKHNYISRQQTSIHDFCREVPIFEVARNQTTSFPITVSFELAKYKTLNVHDMFDETFESLLISNDLPKLCHGENVMSFIHMQRPMH